MVRIRISWLYSFLATRQVVSNCVKLKSANYILHITKISCLNGHFHDLFTKKKREQVLCIPMRVVKGDWNVSRNTVKSLVPFRCLDGIVREPCEMSMTLEPEQRSNFFFNPPVHLCAVSYMTEVSLNVTLTNRSTQSIKTKRRRSDSVL